MIVCVKRILGNLFMYAPALGVFIFAFVSYLSTPVFAATNPTINFQGRLLNAQGAVVPDGFYNVQFKIYQDGTGTAVGNPGGTLKWTENWTNAGGQGVMVKNGYMSVELGTVNPFGAQVDWNQSTLWLSMNIGNTNTTCTPITSCALDGEMVPMKRLSSSPYSMNSNALGGMTAAQFLQLAQGVQVESGANTSSININKTGTGGNFASFLQNGTAAFTITNTGDVVFGNNTDHSISSATVASGTGKNMTVTAGGSSNGGGGTITIVGGSAGTSGNGGNVVITGGAAAGTGMQGLVNIGASSYISAVNPVCAADCTINQNYVDAYSTVVVNASTASINMTLPSPSNSVMGRILYVTTASGSQDFDLVANAGTNTLRVTMKQNTTATMIWNGSAWTPGGASNAITLQATYNNGTNPSETPEIKLDSIRGSIDIQDADTSIGAGQDILAIHSSNATGLGQTLFGVSTEGRVTIQGTTDNSSAFRVLNSGGQYTFNINSANGYTVSNSVKSVGNEIANPGFEAGAGNTDALQKGEEGWFDSSYTQASVLNSSSTARNGNYSLRVTPNNSTINVYAGTYYEIQPGAGLYAEAYMKAPGGNGYGGILISWYNKDKAKIGDTGSTGQIFASAASSWSPVKASAIAPAGTAYAKISAVVDATASVGPYYFDDFYMVRNLQRSDMTFQNSANSTTAFQIQAAGGANTLFRADTTNNIVKVGDNTGTNTDTTVLVLDGTASDPVALAGKNGGLFFNTATNSLKAIINGAVVDVCTTAVTCSGYSASAGSAVALQTTTPGTTQTGNFNINGTGTLSTVRSHDNETLTIKSGDGTGSAPSGNVVIDVGTGTSGGVGNVTIGRAGIKTNFGGTLDVAGGINTSQPNNVSVALGTAGSSTGSILFRTSQGPNTITLKAPEASIASSYTLTLPTAASTQAGYCMKDTGGGQLGFADCAAGVRVTLQDAYDYTNLGAPSITTADNKDLKFVAQNTGTDSNILFDLQCSGTCAANQGRFAVQNNGVDVFTVNPNGAGITLNGDVSIGSGASADSTMHLLTLDNYTGDTEPANKCGMSLNSGSLYYNYKMGSIRGCVGGAWTDISNPDTLGLLTFGVLPSSGSGNDPYDLPALGTSGASGPCKVSRTLNNELTINGCIAYSGGRRVTMMSQIKLCINTNTTGPSSCTNSATTPIQTGTTSTVWGHICVDGDLGRPVWTTTTAQSSATAGLPAWSVVSPTLCLADVKITNNIVDDLYDVRTFSSAMKEAVNTSSAVELGMLVKTSASGAMAPGTTGSQKLYGLVTVADSATPTSAGAPNAIVTTNGPGWVKAASGTAGSFVIESGTPGYAATNSSIPNNSFYYSAGNTRTSYNTTCTATNNCAGSLYVNFIVR